MFHLVRQFNQRIIEKFNIMPEAKQKTLAIGETYTFEQLRDALLSGKGQYFSLSQQVTKGGKVHNAIMHVVHKSGFDMKDEETIIADGEALLFYSDGECLTAGFTDEFTLTGIHNI